MLGSKAKRELKRNQRRILIDSIEIGIPSPQQIYTWGERRLPNGKRVGEIKNSKTVNYKRFTPLRDGLFCERIFGPVNSFVCACGKRQPRADVTFCDKCEVEYTDQRTRRYRLGYIPLVSPVAHIWYLKGRPSYLSLFLGKRKKKIIALAYCNAYLVEQASYLYTTPRPNLNLAPTDVMPHIQEREAHGVNRYTKNIQSSPAIRHISNRFNNSPRSNSHTSKSQSIQASSQKKSLQFPPQFTDLLINTVAPNKSATQNLYSKEKNKTVLKKSRRKNLRNVRSWAHNRKMIAPLFSYPVVGVNAREISGRPAFPEQAKLLASRSRAEPGWKVAAAQPNLSSSTHTPITAQTPQRVLNPYNRAHTLPFLPSLICKYNLRDELLNLLNSAPLGEDRPIYPYCQLERWQALRDVHQFMSEQVLFQSTEGKSSQAGVETRSISDKMPHRNLINRRSQSDLNGSAGLVSNVGEVQIAGAIKSDNQTMYIYKQQSCYESDSLVASDKQPATEVAPDNLIASYKRLIAEPSPYNSRNEVSLSTGASVVGVNTPSKAAYSAEPLPFEVSATKQKAKRASVSENKFTVSRQDSTFSSLELTTIREILSYTGGGALQKLLQRFDTQLFASFLFADIKATRAIFKQKVLQKGYSPTRIQKRILTRLCRRIHKNSRRLKIAQLLTRCKRRPEWMMISILPVLPPDLRPILQMSESVVVASDLNNLYQRVVYRNNRFYKLNFIDFYLVTAIQRLVQDAVDRLIENGKGGSKPFYTPGGRPLKSLSDTLKGKKGRFRLNLLGKRVDFSGRSVIVVSPTLRIHECGLPREIALELYHYFLLRQLMLRKQASSIIMAKKLIQQRNMNQFVWDVLRDIVYHHPVLLNRAPTLHRLGIQAFQPKLVKGNAILLNPLVCSGFNADFDGDQMGVHLPLSTQARAEAWDLLWSRNNLLSPATGQPVLVPSQDMVLGFYYMTQSFSARSLLAIKDHEKDILLERKNARRGNAVTRPREASSFAGYGNARLREASGNAKKVAKLQNNLISRSHTAFPRRPKDRRMPTARKLVSANRVFFNCLELLKAFQNKNIHLHTPVWLQWQGKMENDEGAQIPLELRINHFGSSTYIYSKYKRRKYESLSQSSLYIRTTAGRVLINSIIF